MDKNQEAFFALLRAGLWGVGNPNIRIDGTTDWQEIYQLATEQSVLGLVLAGLEHSNVKPPKELLLQWIGEVQVIEQQNKKMNAYIAELIEKLRNEGVYTLLVKGQGIAQCYERPLWRACGDVDLFLSDDNFGKARDFLAPLASDVKKENKYEKHLSMTIDTWVVELHGNLRCGLSARIDRVLDDIKKSTFYDGNVRLWNNGSTQVFLQIVENDALYVFTHILSHFYKGGIGLRQVCDWCRLQWTYRDSLNYRLLESRIKEAGVMSEWKAFYALAIKYLGMPEVPSFKFYVSSDKCWERKADKICSFIMKVGNFGHNRDKSYYSKYPFLLRKVISLCHRIGDLSRHAQIFPLDSFRFFPYIMINGLREAIRGK